MPFVRFSRDKRGYEHIYLVHAPQGRGRSAPAKVLYWYRTPPGVKVGREPFDENVRHALEAEYPNLQFDWKRIVNTPMPPPEAENWREKRRLMKEMRAARAEEERDARAEEAPPAAAALNATNEADGAPAEVPGGEAAESLTPEGALADRSASVGAPNGQPGQERRRHRRRGGRGRRRGRAGTPLQPFVPPHASAEASAEAPDQNSEQQSDSQSQSVSRAELDVEPDPGDQE